ncbi:unnamed protein product [Xylocopa violacea]|uniref:Uncharacterized protein n=1 Tax=Xylocopa violacea TaxID=135666 RepID=A0ABP1P8A3_XYLVO
MDSSSICSEDDDSSLDSNSKTAIQQDEKNAKEEELTTNVQDKKHSKAILDGSSVRRTFGLNHISQVAKKHISLPKNLKNPFSKSQKNIVHRTLKNSFGQGHKKADTQISHTTLVDIQVEDCRQYAIGEKSLSFSNTSSDNNKDISDCKSIHSQLKSEKKSPINQFKYSSIESVLDSECAKDNKKHCSNKVSTKATIAKDKRFEEHETQANNEKAAESTKKFPWGSKSSKFTSKSFEKTSKDKGKNDSMEKKLKAKKILCSPLRKFGRSSLTIEPDKIMINLPKCSPCACRLAASSKILSIDSSLLSRFTAGRESPHHAVRSRSPSHVDVQMDVSLKSSERTSTQANLFSNIQQFQKSRYTPRSRSVGELCNIVNK